MRCSGPFLLGLMLAGPFVPVLARDKQKFILIKLVLFIDMTLSDHLRNNLKVVDEHKLRQLLEAYIRQVEFNFSGLDSDTFAGVRLDLIETRLYKPDVHLNGDVDQLLDEFCGHQSDEKLNRPVEGDWHLSLLLTSLDLFSGEDTQNYGSLEKSRSTMGVSVIDGISWRSLGCLIVEFGANYDHPMEAHNSSALGETLPISYMNPSRGFASTWVAAHEIGHSLGMHHDGPPFNAECDHGGVMSHDSNLNSINFTWSRCSSDRIDQLVHSSSLASYQFRPPIELENMPGQIFDLRFQCRTFAANLEANYNGSLETICDRTVWCQLSPSAAWHSDEAMFVAIGPALEGTACDEGGSKICFRRQCTPLSHVSLAGFKVNN